MLVEKSIEGSENHFGFPQIDPGFSTDNALIVEEITKELETYLLGESDNSDLTDGVFNFLTILSDQIQSEFEDVIGGNRNKKWFVRALSNIFVLFLNTKVDTAEKIFKKYLKLP